MTDIKYVLIKDDQVKPKILGISSNIITLRYLYIKDRGKYSENGTMNEYDMITSWNYLVDYSIIHFGECRYMLASGEVLYY